MRGNLSALLIMEGVTVAAAISLACAIVSRRFNGDDCTLVFGVVTFLLVTWIVWQDLKYFTISDAAILSIAGLAAAYRFAWDVSVGVASSDTSLLLVMDLVLPGGFMLLLREIYFRRKGHDGLGLGDVKLSLAGGMLAGATGFFWALFLASLAALGYAAWRMVQKRPLRGHDKIAFGAALAPALWLVWALEQWPLQLPPGQP